MLVLDAMDLDGAAQMAAPLLPPLRPPVIKMEMEIDADQPTDSRRANPPDPRNIPIPASRASRAAGPPGRRARRNPIGMPALALLLPSSGERVYDPSETDVPNARVYPSHGVNAHAFLLCLYTPSLLPPTPPQPTRNRRRRRSSRRKTPNNNNDNNQAPGASWCRWMALATGREESGRWQSHCPRSTSPAVSVQRISPVCCCCC